VARLTSMSVTESPMRTHWSVVQVQVTGVIDWSEAGPGDALYVLHVHPTAKARTLQAHGGVRAVDDGSAVHAEVAGRGDLYDADPSVPSQCLGLQQSCGAVEWRTTSRVANSMWWVLTTSLVII
jgi:hypothetical protein